MVGLPSRSTTGLVPINVLSDAVLSLLVELLPQDLPAFGEVEGVTALAAGSYGQRFVRVITDWAAGSASEGPSTGQTTEIDCVALVKVMLALNPCQRVMGWGRAKNLFWESGHLAC